MLYIHFVVLTTPDEQIRATRVLVLSFERSSEVGLRRHHNKYTLVLEAHE